MRIPFVYRPFSSSLGQEDEIEKLNQIYESIVILFENRSSPVPPIVLIGISRGASVILNFLATKQPESVLAAICESPFDTIQSIAQNTAHHYLPKRMQRAGEKLFFSCFSKHDLNGINPLNCVKNIDPRLPILFVASKQDVRVPYELTENLFTIMKNQGKNVYFKLFEDGKHAKILEKNRDEYKEVVDCFLQSCLF